MNKKLLAVAIAGAFIAPAAMADNSSVTISGTLHMSVDSRDNDTSDTTTTKSRSTYVGSHASNILFKGVEDLGNGWDAYWQLQTFVSMGGTGNTDSFGNSALDSSLGYGNTFLGLRSKAAGSFQLGKWDLPVKVIGRKVDLFNNQIGDSRNVLFGRNGETTVTAGNSSGRGSATGFEARPNNLIGYITPNFSGFSASIAYRAPEGTSNSADASMWGIGAEYANGPLYVGVAYEQHREALTSTTTFGGNSINKEKDWRVSAGYDFGPAKLVALYDRKNDLGGVGSNDRTTWGGGVSFKIPGNNLIKGQYYHAGKTGGVSDTEANMYAIGFDHMLSKRTTIYAAYAQTNNKNNAKYSAFGGGHDGAGFLAAGATNGADPSAFSIGMIHNF